MDCVGEKLTRRFKLYPIPNSAFLPPEIYERAKQECQSIPDRLRLEINQAVAVNPNAQAQPVATLGQVFQPAQAPQVAPFSPPGQAIPSLTLPGLSNTPHAGSPAPVTAFTTPVMVSGPKDSDITPIEPTTQEETPPFEVEKDDLPVEEPEVKPTETARRPLKAMF